MLLLLLACAGDDGDSVLTSPELGPRGDCNPVDPEHCMLPFPSSFFLEEDAGTASGYRVAFGETTLPKDKTDVQLSPEAWNRRDGFSITGPLYTLLPGARYDSPGSVLFSNLADYAGADVTSVIVDVETGARVPHYLEREVFPEEAAHAALVLHPVVPLDHARRYVVGLRGLVDDGGAAVAAPEGFATLRDGAETTDPDLERQRAHYEDVVFPALEATGFGRGELQMAWDFVTESEEGSLGGMIKMRDEGLAQVPEAGPAYVIDEVIRGDCTSGNLGRQVEGHFTTPFYLDVDGPNAVLVLGDDGLPVQNGTAEVPFTVAIPCSVLQDPSPSLLIQGGHGLFGMHTDVATNPWVNVADRAHAVVFGTSWRGLSYDDYDDVTVMMATHPDRFHQIPDELMQAHLEAMVMARLIRGALAQDEALQVDGVSVVDPTRMVYYGVSLGTVLGGAQVAMSDHDRALMQIAGMPFSALLTRSSAFGAFLDLLGAKFRDPVDVSMIVPLAQMLWQPSESGGWAHSLVDGAHTGGVDGRRFLIQVGIGDDTVTSLGGHLYGRAVGAGLLDVAPRPVFGLEAKTDTTSGSGLLEWDYGYTENPVPAPQGLDPDPHWMVPGEESAIAQAAAFLATGDLASACDGVCDPD